MTELEEYVYTHLGEINQVLAQLPTWLKSTLLQTRNKNLEGDKLPQLILSAKEKYLPLAAKNIIPHGLSYCRENQSQLVIHPQSIVDLIMIGMMIDGQGRKITDHVFTITPIIGAGILGHLNDLELTEEEFRLINEESIKFHTARSK